MGSQQKTCGNSNTFQWEFATQNYGADITCRLSIGADITCRRSIGKILTEVLKKDMKSTELVLGDDNVD